MTFLVDFITLLPQDLFLLHMIQYHIWTCIHTEDKYQPFCYCFGPTFGQPKASLCLAFPIACLGTFKEIVSNNIWHIGRHIGRHISFKPSESGLLTQHPSEVNVTWHSVQKGASSNFHSDNNLVTSRKPLSLSFVIWKRVYKHKQMIYVYL